MCNIIQDARVDITLQQIMDVVIMLNTRSTFGRIVDLIMNMDIPIHLPPGPVTCSASGGSRTCRRESTESSGRGLSKYAPFCAAEGDVAVDSRIEDDDAGSQLSYLEPHSPARSVQNPASARSDEYPPALSAQAGYQPSLEGGASPRGLGLRFSYANGDSIPVGRPDDVAIPLLPLLPSDFNIDPAGALFPLKLARPHSELLGSDSGPSSDCKRRRVLPQLLAPDDGNVWCCVLRGKKAGVVRGRISAGVMTDGFPGAVCIECPCRKSAEETFMNGWHGGKVYSEEGDLIGIDLCLADDTV